MVYEKINWENAPSKKTPISAENLNKMDKGILDAHDRLNGTVDKNNPVITGSINMGRTEGSTVGEDSVALGLDVQAMSANSMAFGTNTVAGMKGYYIKSIDLTNKKIYLTDTKVLPVISTDDNTDTSFETPAYDVGDYFNIFNKAKYIRCANIASINNNVVAYNGDLGFAEILESNLGFSEVVEEDECDYTFSVSAKSEIGTVVIGGAQSFVVGRDNHAAGKDSFVGGWDNVAISNFATVFGAHNKAEYCANAEGVGNEASGQASHAEGSWNKSYGYASHAEGDTNEVFGDFSHGEGRYTKALGRYSHTEGSETLVQADVSYGHAEGYKTTVTNHAGHAEGGEAKASGQYAHAEGEKTIAIGKGSHAEGGYSTGDNGTILSTTANGAYSHAEGMNTHANSEFSHAEGAHTEANAMCAHAEGNSSKATGQWSHAEGFKSESIGVQSHAEGSETKANGNSSHTEGASTVANGIASHAEGSNTSAGGNYSHAEGQETIASNIGTHAEGYKSKASNQYAHAEGYKTTASGLYAHSEGQETIAHGPFSHAEGIQCETTSLAGAGHAEGYVCKAIAAGAHAEGESTIASGYHSHAEGLGTLASSARQHVQGQYNVEDKTTDGYALGKYAHIVGYGSKSGNEITRSNIHTIKWVNGQGFFKGGITTEGADYAEYFEWLDGNKDDEDRIGLLVSLDGDKIKVANKGDEILGIISGTASVIGDNYECEWNGKYLIDDFGRVQYELVEEFVDVINYIDEETKEVVMKQESIGFQKHPKLNPNYDPEKEYINREDRPEWDAVGMIGKLFVCDDGSCQINGYAKASENGIATASSEETNMRVLSRVNESIVRVLLK